MMKKPKQPIIIALAFCFLLFVQGCATMGNDTVQEETEASSHPEVTPSESAEPQVESTSISSPNSDDGGSETTHAEDAKESSGDPADEPAVVPEDPADEPVVVPEEPLPENEVAPPSIEPVARTTKEAEDFFETGLKFYYGDKDLLPDRSIAFRCFLLAAKRGHKDAAYRVGVCMLAGRGTRKNPAEARRWLRIASSRGSFLAEELLKDL